MKLNIDLKKLDWLKKITSNVSIVLVGFLVVIALLVGFIIWGEVHRALQLGSSSESGQNQVVRVNQQQYKELEDTLDANSRFVPTSMPKASVFSSPPANSGQ